MQKEYLSEHAFNSFGFSNPMNRLPILDNIIKQTKEADIQDSALGNFWQTKVPFIKMGSMEEENLNYFVLCETESKRITWVGDRLNSGILYILKKIYKHSLHTYLNLQSISTAWEMKSIYSSPDRPPHWEPAGAPHMGVTEDRPTIYLRLKPNKLP